MKVQVQKMMKWERLPRGHSSLTYSLRPFSLDNLLILAFFNLKTSMMMHVARNQLKTSTYISGVEATS